jgi:hypothetical protein
MVACCINYMVTINADRSSKMSNCTPFQLLPWTSSLVLVYYLLGVLAAANLVNVQIKLIEQCLNCTVSMLNSD